MTLRVASGSGLVEPPRERPEGNRPHGADAAGRARRLPRLHLVADASRPEHRQAEMDREGRDRVGAVGTVYYDADGRVLGSMQYGPAELFSRAAGLPAGPPSDDAVLVTCAYLVEASSPWVMQSLFLAAIGDSRDRGAKALETFAYRYREGESQYERFQVHKTIFPADFSRTSAFERSGARARGAGAARVRGARAGRGGEAGEGDPGREGGLRPAPVPQRP